ncbi:MAG: FG-GAP repeat domain-containing protein, partial [Planctomycetota bacterium]
SSNGFSLDVLRGPASLAYLNEKYARIGTENLPRTKELGLISHPAIAAADLDSDRLVDLVSFSDKGRVAIHLNLGPTRNPAVKAHFATKSALYTVVPMRTWGKDFTLLRTNSLEVDDFDGDGTMDIAYCADIQVLVEILDYSGVRILTGNNKGGISGERLIMRGRFYQMASAELNGDGKRDFVALRPMNDFDVGIFQRPGIYTQQRIHANIPASPRRLALGDVDGNGRADIVLGGGKKDVELGLYLTNLKGVPGAARRIPLPSRPRRSIDTIVIADLDRDTRQDIAILLATDVGTSEILYLRGHGNGSFDAALSFPLPGSVSGTETPSFLGHLHASDLNGDRAPELIATSLIDQKTESVMHYILPNLTSKEGGIHYSGTPLPGAKGLIPSISAVGGLPVLGNDKFTIMLANVPGKAAEAVLSLGIRKIPAHGLWGLINIFPTQVFPTKTTGWSLGGGMAKIPMGVPLDTQFKGRRFLFQWLLRDPGAPHVLRLSRSKVLEVFVQEK